MSSEARNDFVVKTEGQCFFCDDKILKVKWESQTELETASQIHSLQYLSRYLKLDMGKVFHEEGPIPPHLLAMVEGARLKAELCEECTHLTESFTKMYRSMEKIEMEMKFMLSLIKRKLIKSTNYGSKQSKVEGTELTGTKKIVEVLRSESIQKCSNKLAAATITPIVRVSVQNMNAAQISTEKCKIKRISSKKKVVRVTQVAHGYFDGPENTVNEIKLEPANSAADSQPVSEDYEHDDLQSNDGNNYANDDDLREELDESIIQLPSMEASNFNTNVEELNSHSRLNPNTGKFRCTLCSKEFSRRDVFRFHYRNIHLKIKYKCNLCGKEFKYERDYDRHHRSVHLAINFKCDQCNKSFKRRYQLTTHLRKTNHACMRIPKK